jgi:sulfur-oxidizing protein SoxY
MNRREFLATGSSLAVTMAMGTQAVFAMPDEVREAIRLVVGSAPINPGRVKLDLPPLVENGNVVPIKIAVDSPMSGSDRVRAIHLFAEKNPLPVVAVFRFGPRAGRAEVEARIRLADSQAVIAICEMSDGSFWSDRVDTVVTLAACVEPA